MSDVRAMLRAERANRGPQPVGKKRKAAGLSTGSPAESRKRVKSDDEQPPAPTEPAQAPATEDAATPADVIPAPEERPQSQPEEPTVSDLQAFDRELAALETLHQSIITNPTPASTTTYTGATISAAPLTAAQIAAQAREQQSTQRGLRDEEIEAEKEDAEAGLREEMEEMRGLEERVRRLRERREEVRQGKMAVVGEGPGEGRVEDEEEEQDEVLNEGEEEEEEEEDLDDVDSDWVFQEVTNNVRKLRGAAIAKAK